MSFLVPDKIRTEKIGTEIITIKEKIIPSGKRKKDGSKFKPERSMTPKGATVHNTNEITVPKGTTPAEQYTRATYPNGNMKTAAPHFFVWKDEIWQQLSETEQGWHASDGATRRKGKRGTPVGGNLDTISIECIGKDPESEKTTALLVAYLIKKYKWEAKKDVYTHNYFMFGHDNIVQGARKNCPIYILPKWKTFISIVESFVNNSGLASPNNTVTDRVELAPYTYKIKNGDTLYAIAHKFNTTVAAIVDLNKISNANMIQIGDIIKVPQNSSKTQSKANLKVDGDWGPATTRELQKHFGTTVDGKISTPKSLLIIAIQKHLNLPQTGRIDPPTIRGMQKHFGTPVDGVISKPSMMVKEMQRQLNKGKF